MTRHPLRRLAPALALALVLVTSACGGASEGSSTSNSNSNSNSAAIPEPGAGEGDEVVIKTFIFRPDPLTVPAGTTVTFTNLDDILHTVTAGERGAPSGQFDGDLQGIDSTFRFTFDEPGTYAYHCTIHPGMDATVVVR